MEHYPERIGTIRRGVGEFVVKNPVRAELVEALFFFFGSIDGSEVQPFDKLRANG